jgi:hypothetical protein
MFNKTTIDPSYAVQSQQGGCQCPANGFSADVTKAPPVVFLWLGLAFALGVMIGK